MKLNSYIAHNSWECRDFVRYLPEFVLLLFVLFRIAGYGVGNHSLLRLEGEFYVILVSASVWYLCRDLLQTGQQRNGIILLHGLVFGLSAFTVIGAYGMMGITGDQLNVLIQKMGGSSRAGTNLFLILNGAMMLITLIIVCGLYTSITKSDLYFGLVCHGIGSLISIYFVKVFLSVMSLPLEYSKEQQISEWLCVAGPYVIGIILTFLYCFKKSGVHARQIERKW